MLEMAQPLKAAYPDRKISTLTIPDAVAQIMALFVPSMRSVVPNLGRNGDVDGSDGPRELGFEYSSSQDSLRASANYLLERGVVE
ncbi:MAG: hypothetical protein ACK5MT_07590 [Actinomycetales bacterium]